MFQRLQRSLRHVLSGLTIAVILTAVPVFSRVSAQVVPPALAPPAAAPPAAAQAPAPTTASRPAPGIPAPSTAPQLVPGVALGDCGDLAQAMVRTYSSRPRPTSSATKTCEGGRIQMRVEVDRHFGYRIMDPMRVRVLLNFEPTTLIDLDSLRRGTITFNGQEFDLVAPFALPASAAPVDVQARSLQNGSVLLKIELLVQSSVPASVAPYLVFRLDLRYAMGNIRDAQGQATSSPDWRVLSTPLVGVTMSQTAVAGDQFRDTALEPVQQVRPWPTLWLVILGIFSMLFMPGYVVVRWINRHRPGRKPSREEVAWLVLDTVRAAARENDGYTKGNVRRIAHAVRVYFGVQSATTSEVQSRIGNHPHIAEILDVLRTCDDVLFERGAVEHVDVRAFQRKLALIIPRP